MAATGKCWKINKAQIQLLIDNADINSNCFIEVWNDTGSDISSCELYLKLAAGWTDSWPGDPPEDPN